LPVLISLINEYHNYLKVIRRQRFSKHRHSKRSGIVKIPSKLKKQGSLACILQRYSAGHISPELSFSTHFSRDFQENIRNLNNYP